VDLWHVLPDSERDRWELDPLKAVGPLRFGMPQSAADIYHKLGAAAWATF
jgi:hypothetical protein